MGLPDFLVVGVPKAGSTALHAALARHPGLFLSAVKEPKFFLTDGPPPDRGGPGDAATYREHVWRRQDYEALFAAAPPGAPRGESTPFYLYDRDAQRRIHALVPDARLIAVLRDPVDRAHSNWTHLWAAGLEPEADFVAACADEERRKAAGWAHFWHYVGLGRYGEQLRDLYTLFPREQVLLLRYRDLRDTPATTLDRVTAFLGVTSGLIHEVPAENVTTEVSRGRGVRTFQRVLQAGAALGNVSHERLRHASARGPLRTLQGGRPRTPLTADQRARVLPWFADDIQLLEQVTGEPFADWLTAGDVPIAAGPNAGE